MKKFFLLTCAVTLIVSILGGLLSLASPFIGLGSNEDFLLWQHFGVARRELALFSLQLLGLVIAIATTSLLAPAAAAGMRDLFRHILASKNSIRRAIVGALALTISFFFSFLLLEASFRVYLYFSVKSFIIEAAIAQRPEDALGISLYDAHVGVRYRPNVQVDRRGGAFPIAYQTNQHGHIAREDYPIEKPAGEFRIGVVGDSFTANETNTLRWSDILQDILNNNAEWREFVAGKTTRVINFGISGVSTIQFGDIVDHNVRHFDIDFLILNIIMEDIGRRKYFYGSIENLSYDEYLRSVTARSVDQLPWFGFFSEALSTIFEPHFGAKRRLTSEAAGKLLNVTQNRFFSDPAEAADLSSIVARKIQSQFKNAIWLHHPTYQELSGLQMLHDADMLKAAYDLFVRQTPEIKVIEMARYMPKPGSQAEIDSWYNVPYDFHPSDQGLTIYANAVSKVLLRYVVELQQQPTR